MLNWLNGLHLFLLKNVLLLCLIQWCGIIMTLNLYEISLFVQISHRCICISILGVCFLLISIWLDLQVQTALSLCLLGSCEWWQPDEWPHMVKKCSQIN